MRIIVIGGGEIGYGLAQALSARHEVVVVDQDPATADRFEKLDVEFIVGGGTSADVLARAGIEQAGKFVACTGLDEVNIVACGMARQLGRPDTICFVSREDFLELSSQPDGLTRFGIDRVIWPEAQLADDIERIVVTPGAIDAEVFENGAIRLVEYRLEAGSPLTERPLAELALPHGALLLAVRRGDTFFIPRGDTRLVAGDKPIVMGTREAMADLQRWVVPAQHHRRQTATIVGGGDVGLRLAEKLDGMGDVQLRIVEQDRARGEMLAARLGHALVLHGDGTDLAFLEAEDIGRSDVLVSVIDNDERNLLASLLGRQLGVRRVITRVSKPANLRLFERVGIDVAISARGAAVTSVLHEVEGGQASLLAVLEEGEGRILEVQVPARHDGQALRDVHVPRDSIVAAILRGPDAIVPHGTDRVRAGDRLFVFCTREAVDETRTFFSPDR